MGSPTRLRRPLFGFLRAFVWFKEHRNKNSWEADWIGEEWSNPGRRRLCVCASQRQYFRTTSCPPRPAANFSVAKFSPVLSILHADFTVIQDYRASLVSFVISSGVWVRNTTTGQPSHSLWNIHSGHTFGSLFDADQDPANTFLIIFFHNFFRRLISRYHLFTVSLFSHAAKLCSGWWVTNLSPLCVCATWRPTRSEAHRRAHRRYWLHDYLAAIIRLFIWQFRQ